MSKQEEFTTEQTEEHGGEETRSEEQKKFDRISATRNHNTIPRATVTSHHGASNRQAG